MKKSLISLLCAIVLGFVLSGWMIAVISVLVAIGALIWSRTMLAKICLVYMWVFGVIVPYAPIILGLDTYYQLCEAHQVGVLTPSVLSFGLPTPVAREMFPLGYNLLGSDYPEHVCHLAQQGVGVRLISSITYISSIVILHTIMYPLCCNVLRTRKKYAESQTVTTDPVAVLDSGKAEISFDKERVSVGLVITVVMTIGVLCAVFIFGNSLANASEESRVRQQCKDDMRCISHWCSQGIRGAVPMCENTYLLTGLSHIFTPYSEGVSEDTNIDTVVLDQEMCDSAWYVCTKDNKFILPDIKIITPLLQSGEIGNSHNENTYLAFGVAKQRVLALKYPKGLSVREYRGKSGYLVKSEFSNAKTNQITAVLHFINDATFKYTDDYQFIESGTSPRQFIAYPYMCDRVGGETSCDGDIVFDPRYADTISLFGSTLKLLDSREMGWSYLRDSDTGIGFLMQSRIDYGFHSPIIDVTRAVIIPSSGDTLTCFADGTCRSGKASTEEIAPVSEY